jgi:hypothetical protein
MILKVSNDFCTGHEAVRVVALIFRPGQPDGPVGREKGKRVLAAIAPGVASFSRLLKHDVFVILLRQIVAGGQPAAGDE